MATIDDRMQELEEPAWRNLAPSIIRQRLIIEATTSRIVEPSQMINYLKELAHRTAMEILSGPFAGSAHELGYGGWVHWRTSGAHVYSYPAHPPEQSHPLLTVDTYTCKPFSVPDVVAFTQRYFSTREMVWKEIEI